MAFASGASYTLNARRPRVPPARMSGLGPWADSLNPAPRLRSETELSRAPKEAVLAERVSIDVGTWTVPVRRPRSAVIQRNPLLLRRINEVMREGRQGQIGTEWIPFFCECQRDDCYEPFWLTADEYDELRTETQRPLVLPGHEDARSERQGLRALR